MTNAPTNDSSRVYCEEHSGKHVETAECVWPHDVAPPGREPKVGHPLRSDD